MPMPIEALRIRKKVMKTPAYQVASPAGPAAANRITPQNIWAAPERSRKAERLLARAAPLKSLIGIQ